MCARLGVPRVSHRFGVSTSFADERRGDGFHEKFCVSRGRSPRLIAEGRPKSLMRDRLQLSDSHDEACDVRILAPATLSKSST